MKDEMRTFSFTCQTEKGTASTSVVDGEVLCHSLSFACKQFYLTTLVLYSGLLAATWDI